MKNLDRRFAPAFIFALICACSSNGESTPEASDPTGGAAGAAGENPQGMVDPLTPGGPAGSGGSANGEGGNPELPLAGNTAGSGNAAGSGNSAGSGGTGPNNNELPPFVAPTTPDPDVFTGPPQLLRQAATLTERLVGTAVRANRLNNATYTAAAREFSYVTPENEMKWDALEREPGVFTFANGNRIVQFAEANHMQVKGHTLVWHSQIPAWVRAMTTREEALTAMERHITEVVGHYKGRVHAWDVVNEAFTDGNNSRLRGSDPNDVNDPNNSNGNNGPDSPFRRLIGEDYIDRAFTLARAADPDALLFYNDFNTEGTNAKANAVFAMVQSMKQRGVPIDGVGLQMHINAAGGVTVQQLTQNIQRLTALGLQVVFSELDVTLCGNADIAQRRQQQKTRLADVTKACTDNPLCTAITFWGIADTDSWRNSTCNGGGSEPLLFDTNYQRKDAYFGVFDTLVTAGNAAP